MCRFFTSQNPESSYGVLGFFELFRKFYAMKEYSEVMFRKVYTPLMEGENYSFFLAVHLELSLEDILIQWRCYQ